MGNSSSGRKSNNAAFQSIQTAVEQPKGMVCREKKLWAAIINDYPSTHFVKSDGMMLLNYVRVTILLNETLDETLNPPEDGPKKLILASDLTSLVGMQTKLAIALRLGPAQRMSQQKAESARNKPKQPSAQDVEKGEVPAWKQRLGAPGSARTN